MWERESRLDAGKQEETERKRERELSGVRRRDDAGRLRANFRVRVLAAPPEGTLSIRVAKEIPGYVGSTTL